MTEEVRCKSCQAVIDPASIDRQRELATCAKCGWLTDLRQSRGSTADAAPMPGKARARANVELPVGMSVATGTGVVIRRRWLRGKHWFLLLLFAPAGIYLAYLWSSIEVNAWLVIGTLFVSSWYYNVLGAFVNSTVVSADADGVRVKHGPLPSMFARNSAVAKADIEQLYSASFGALFAVHAKLKSKKTVPLVVPLVTAEQALFVEQQLERVLGVVDFAVDGELDGGSLNLQGKRAAGAGAGVGVAFALPVFIAAVLGLFFFVSSTEVSGKLKSSGDLGSWTFEPDECSSGQREGFGGVVLTSSAQPERVVRVINDPVRGKLVVVASSGRPNHVLAADACPRFEVNAVRGNTSINDIWTMDGSVSLECGALSGSVTFEGCH